LLGAVAPVRLRDEVLLAAVSESITIVDLSATPDWVLVAGGTLVVAFIIWILIMVLRWALWLLFFGVMLGGLGWAGWLLLQP